MNMESVEGLKLQELALLAKDFIDADDDVAKNGWTSENEVEHQNAKIRLRELVEKILSHQIKRTPIG